MLSDAQHRRRRRGTGSCREKQKTLDSRGFPVLFPSGGESTQPTGVVDRRHLNGAGGEGGLGLEPVSLERRHRREEMVLIPSVLFGRRRGK